MIEKRLVDGQEIEFDTELGGVVKQAGPPEDVQVSAVQKTPRAPFVVGIWDGHAPDPATELAPTTETPVEPDPAPDSSTKNQWRTENADISTQPTT